MAQMTRTGPPAGPGAGPDRALALRLGTAAALAVVAAALTYLLFVRTSLGQRFDDSAYDGARAQAAGSGGAGSTMLRRITGDSFALVLVGLVAFGVLRRRAVLGAAAAFAAGVAVAVTEGLKTDILPRPDLTGAVSSNTFPSGHTAAAVACALALVLVSPVRWRGVAAVVAGAYAWVTAAEVQTAGWHRPSDAIGASFLSFAAVAAVAAVIAATRPVRPPHRPGRGHRGALAVLGVAAVVDGVVVVARVVADLTYLRAHVADHVAGGFRHDASLTGVTVTVEVVVLLVTAMLVLVGRVDLDARPGAGP